MSSVNDNNNNYESDVIDLTDPISEQKKKNIEINDNELDDEDNFESINIKNKDKVQVDYKSQKAHQIKNINKQNEIENINGPDLLMSSDTARAAVNEIGSLLKTINNKKTKKISKGTTVEDLFIEAVKPYLVNWMNENLSDLVSSIIEKEIKKIISENI